MHAIALSLAVAAFAQVAVDNAGDIKNRVDELVRQLDARDRADRVSAEKQLIEMGPSVLPLLPEIDASTSAEKKSRLTRIRSVLEKASTVDDVRQTTITLKGTYSLAELFDEIQKQTGNQIVDFRNRFGQPDDNFTIEVDFEKTPFWKALDTILDQTGLTVYNFSGEIRKLALVARTPGERDRVGSGVYSGPFRIEATEVFAQRNLRNPMLAGMRIRMEVLWEPRLSPLVIRQSYGNIQVTTDEGNEVASTAPQGTAEIPVQSTVAGVDLVIPLELPERSAKSITLLKGAMTALVPGRQVEFEFDNLEGARGITKTQSGVAVTLDRVSKNRSVYEIRVRVKLLNAPADIPTHLDWAANNVVTLIGKDGKRVEDPNFERYLERENEIGFAYLFPLEEDIKHYKLKYRTPASLIETTIEYELSDIPLP